MSIRINNKIISGSYTSQSYRYVGEIFQSALPIEDSRVALLDGHTISESEGYGSFIQYITSLASLYPQLACTEDEWQLYNTTYGECGKFVINEYNVRLPKIVSFVQGLSSLQDLTTLVEAGLPNIEATAKLKYANDTVSGALISSTFTQESLGLISGGTSGIINLSFSAQDSNSIYGNSDTVQPQSIRYPYYIVLATGVTQEVKVKEELMTNIPFTLFESKYSEIKLNNISWLLSSGQWNSKELYPSAYNELVKEYNAGSNKYNIKLHTDECGDYDFVLNLDDETFRLPLKSKFLPVRENSSVVGNGMTLGLTNGTYERGMVYGNYASSYYGFVPNADVLGKPIGTSGNTEVQGVATSWGITTDPTKSGLELYNDISDLYLYFYVGETVQNTNLINAGRIEEKLCDKLDRSAVKAYITESYISGTSWYRVWSDGWKEQGGRAISSATVTFLKEFSNTNYTTNMQVVEFNNNGAVGPDVLSVASKTTKTMKMGTVTSQFTGHVFEWYACGY